MIPISMVFIPFSLSETMSMGWFISFIVISAFDAVLGGAFYGHVGC